MGAVWKNITNVVSLDALVFVGVFLVIALGIGGLAVAFERAGKREQAALRDFARKHEFAFTFHANQLNISGRYKGRDVSVTDGIRIYEGPMQTFYATAVSVSLRPLVPQALNVLWDRRGAATVSGVPESAHPLITECLRADPPASVSGGTLHRCVRKVRREPNFILSLLDTAVEHADRLERHFQQHSAKDARS